MQIEDSSTLENDIIPLTPFERALEIIDAEVGQWKSLHYPTLNLEEQVVKLAMRTRSWISPRSVLAGVGDIMAAVPVPGGGRMTTAQVEQLATELAKQLMDAGLLIAQPRRAGMLSG